MIPNSLIQECRLLSVLHQRLGDVQQHELLPVRQGEVVRRETEGRRLESGQGDRCQDPQQAERHHQETR